MSTPERTDQQNLAEVLVDHMLAEGLTHGAVEVLRAEEDGTAVEWTVEIRRKN